MPVKLLDRDSALQRCRGDGDELTSRFHAFVETAVEELAGLEKAIATTDLALLKKSVRLILEAADDVFAVRAAEVAKALWNKCEQADEEGPPWDTCKVLAEEVGEVLRSTARTLLSMGYFRADTKKANWVADFCGLEAGVDHMDTGGLLERLTKNSTPSKVRSESVNLPRTIQEDFPAAPAPPGRSVQSSLADVTVGARSFAVRPRREPSVSAGDVPTDVDTNLVPPPPAKARLGSDRSLGSNESVKFPSRPRTTLFPLSDTMSETDCAAIQYMGRLHDIQQNFHNCTTLKDLGAAVVLSCESVVAPLAYVGFYLIDHEETASGPRVNPRLVYATGLKLANTGGYRAPPVNRMVVDCAAKKVEIVKNNPNSTSVRQISKYLCNQQVVAQVVARLAIPVFSADRKVAAVIDIASYYEEACKVMMLTGFTVIAQQVSMFLGYVQDIVELTELMDGVSADTAPKTSLRRCAQRLREGLRMDGEEGGDAGSGTDTKPASTAVVETLMSQLGVMAGVDDAGSRTRSISAIVAGAVEVTALLERESQTTVNNLISSGAGAVETLDNAMSTAVVMVLDRVQTDLAAPRFVFLSMQTDGNLATLKISMASPSLNFTAELEQSIAPLSRYVTHILAAIQGRVHSRFTVSPSGMNTVEYSLVFSKELRAKEPEIAPCDLESLRTPSKAATKSSSETWSESSRNSSLNQPSAEPPRSLLTTTSDSDRPRFKVLHVDDDKMNRIMIRSFFKDMSQYECISATSAHEALQIVQAVDVDIALMDVQMPVMDGLEMCRHFRRDFHLSKLPIIMVSAHSKVGDIEQGFKAGANDYLIKPVRKSDLLAKVESHIRISRATSTPGQGEVITMNDFQTQLANLTRAYSPFVPQEMMFYLQRESIVDVELGDNVSWNMAVMFVDIRNFTNMSEMMAPQEIFDFLLNFRKTIVPIIHTNRGYVDKFTGDGFLAIFDEHRSALFAAISMNRSLSNIKMKGGFKLNIGVGIHSGQVIFGIIGDQRRMEGTVISDCVNLASRIESLTKTYGSTILISEDYLSSVGTDIMSMMDHSHRYVGNVQVMGRTEPVKLYDVYCADKPEVVKFKRATQVKFERGVQLYEDGQWAEAKVLFEDLQQMDGQEVKDEAVSLFLQRIRERQHGDGVQQGVGDEFKGYEIMTAK